MLRIGIVGAENTHCAAIAKIMNVDRSVRGRVVSVWGETPAFAAAAAEAGRIPKIVNDWREMAGEVDGVMIDHRHAGDHAEVARFFIENDVPCFVDKPFTFTLKEGKDLCRLARKRGVPVTSFSVRVLQQSFKDFRRKLKKIGRLDYIASTGPADLNSKYGGVFFYGIHQVDTIIELLGNHVDSVSIQPHGKSGGVATMHYRNGPLATINCQVSGLRDFHSSVVGEDGVLDWTFDMDPNPYLAGARLFAKMFRTGQEPFSYERMLAPIAALEALAKSLKEGRPVKVANCSL